MKKLISAIGILAIVFVISSCSTQNPTQYFDRAALNSNLVSGAYRTSFLNEIREHKKRGSATSSAEAYVNDRAIKPVDEAIGKVKNLKQTDDTKELIAASLAYFEYGQNIFKNDYIAVAKMIDENKPDAAIDSALQTIYNNHDPKMGALYDQLDAAANAYAKKHNIPVM